MYADSWKKVVRCAKICVHISILVLVKCVIAFPSENTCTISKRICRTQGSKVANVMNPLEHHNRITICLRSYFEEGRMRLGKWELTRKARATYSSGAECWGSPPERNLPRWERRRCCGRSFSINGASRGREGMIEWHFSVKSGPQRHNNISKIF